MSMISAFTRLTASLLLALCVCSITPVGARAQASRSLSAEDRADLDRADAVLRGIRTMHAHFVQTGSNGATVSGEAWIQRPGLMRFQYAPPAPYLLVANGSFLVFHDSQLGQTSNIALASTPLGILLDDKAGLHDVDVLAVHRGNGLEITVARRGRPGEGSIMLVFAEAPLRLTGWVVRDAQGMRTRVALHDVELGVQAPASLFQFVDPRFWGSDMHG